MALPPQFTQIPANPQACGLCSAHRRAELHMSMPDPRALKKGRRPPKMAAALELERFLTGVVPPHPPQADYLGATGWKMLGNGPDPENAASGVPPGGAGDCVAVTWANERRMVTRALGPAESYPPLSQVVQLYKTQNPAFPRQDDGMDIQTCLEYLHRTGGPDGVKLVAFAKVDYTVPDQVKAAIAIFGQVWLGINVQDANMDDFGTAHPWNYHRGAADDGGHSIVVGGYGPAGGGIGPLGGDERFITWGEETSFTDTFWSHQVEECWVAIWPEHLGTRAFQQGVDINQLASDYMALTGQVFDVPIPPPAPPLGPEPVTALDQTFMAALVRANAAGVRWVDQHHTGYVAEVARAGRAWIGGKLHQPG